MKLLLNEHEAQNEIQRLKNGMEYRFWEGDSIPAYGLDIKFSKEGVMKYVVLLKQKDFAASLFEYLISRMNENNFVAFNYSEIRDTFGCCTKSITRAIKLLQDQDIIAMLSNKGTYVCAINPDICTTVRDSKKLLMPGSIVIKHNEIAKVV